MSVPSYPGAGYAPGPRSRPTIVTIASYLLYAFAVIEVINALIGFATVGTLRDAVANAYTGTDAEGAEVVVSAILIAGGVINLIIGLVFAVLAFLNNKGKNPSRIVTWVLGGISLCCVGGGLGSGSLVNSMNAGSTTTTGPSDAEVQRRIEAATPSWYTPTTTTLTVLGLFAVLAAVVLLALPASNEFFRKKTGTAWDPGYVQPPYPAQGYPGSQPNPYPSPSPYPSPFPGQHQPGQPSYPNQGQPGQPAPGLPPYPGQSSPPPATNPFAAPPASDPYASPPPASDPFAAPPPTSNPFAPPPPSGSPPPASPPGDTRGDTPGDDRPPTKSS